MCCKGISVRVMSSQQLFFSYQGYKHRCFSLHLYVNLVQFTFSCRCQQSKIFSPFGKISIFFFLSYTFLSHPQNWSNPRKNVWRHHKNTILGDFLMSYVESEREQKMTKKLMEIQFAWERVTCVLFRQKLNIEFEKMAKIKIDFRAYGVTQEQSVGKWEFNFPPSWIDQRWLSACTYMTEFLEIKYTFQNIPMQIIARNGREWRRNTNTFKHSIHFTVTANIPTSGHVHHICRRSFSVWWGLAETESNKRDVTSDMVWVSVIKDTHTSAISYNTVVSCDLT